MAERKSLRQASKNATEAIAAAAGGSKARQGPGIIPSKYRCSKKSPSLPKGKLTARKASPIERLANAREVKRITKRVTFSKDPIPTFNDLTNKQKKLLIESILLGYCRFLHDGGTNMAPADLHDYSTVGLPATDRAVLRGTRLCEADEDTVPRGKIKPDCVPTMIHGKQRRPPFLDIGGTCSCTIEMETDGRVDLGHDPYCLRKHFTTRWGVLEDQWETEWGPPQGGATVYWDDTQMMIQTEGRESGLWVDLNEKSDLRCADSKKTSLIDRISSPWLLHRITANFRAPSFTENDAYKCSWSFSFWHQEDPTCYLEIREHKGWPEADFRGSEKSSNEALQLLEWLSGVNCPLSYDYTPCGIHA